MLKLNLIVAIIALNIIGSYQQCANTYTVKAGDSCWAIWTVSRITEQMFYSYNPGIDCGNLKPGQVVCLSAYVTTAAPTVAPATYLIPSCSRLYIVQPGDTCYKMWTSAGISEASFYAMNPYINCNALQAGDWICLSGATAAPTTVWTTAAPTTIWTTAPPTLIPTIITTQAPTTAVWTPPLIPGCTASHTVRQGDLCWSIMSYYNLDPATFMNLNPSLDCNNLQVGQQVCVSTGVWTTAPPTAAPTVWTTLAPTAAPTVWTTLAPTAAPTVWTTLAPTAAPTVWTTVAPYISSCAYPYAVKSGDTCWGIANQVTNIGDAAFMAANPGINCGALQVGQIVCLSGGCGARTYVVQPGDTCWSIWTKYGISEVSFYSMNPSLNCGALKVGDVVTVGRTC